MHVLTDLLAREGAYGAILLALGAGPASFLSDRFDAGSRIALAPILGFCLGTCVATTVLEFIPTGSSYWMLVPLALGSAALAVWRTLKARRSESWRRRLPARDVVALLLVCLTVIGPLSYVLHERHSVGPTAYYYTDVDNYVAVQDAAQRTSLHSARQEWLRHASAGTRFANLTQREWAFIAWFDNNLDATPLNSNVNALLGLGATATNSPFLIMMLLMGALGAFAAVRYATRSRTWMAVIAGALFGGPLFLELWFDGYQAAIIGLGLLMPICMLGAETLRGHRRADVWLLALTLACLLTAYPLYVPIIVVAGGLVLAWTGWRRSRRGEPVRGNLRLVLGRVALLIALTIVFNLVAFTRAITYYHRVLNNTFALPRVSYHLPLEVLPGWLAQTREFWLLTPLGSGGLKQVLLGALIPAAFLAIIVVGLRRHRIALALVALAGLAALTAYYSYSSREACTYCGERDTLALAPIVVVLAALGLASLLATPSRWSRAIGVAGAVLVALAVGQRARVELQRFSNGSYFLDSADRSVLSHLPKSANAVLLEGFGETTSAQGEQPLVYHLANEYLPGRVSIVLGSDLYGGIEYLDFGHVVSPGPEFNPHYEYVLTRLPGIETTRRVIARSGGIALERRTQPLDIMTYAGIVAPLERIDYTGTAWLQPEMPLEMYISGATPGPVWARLKLVGSEPITVPPQAGVRTRYRGDGVFVCVPASSRPPIRSASLRIAAAPLWGPIPHEPYPPPIPQEGVALAAMRAVVGHCTP
jgi:hypothetical protein